MSLVGKDLVTLIPKQEAIILSICLACQLTLQIIAPSGTELREGPRANSQHSNTASQRRQELPDGWAHLDTVDLVNEFQ